MEAPAEIRLFAAAYEERSFTAAARRENATQSGVSQHVRKLEDRFGVKLFERQTGEILPTPAGHEFYRHCIEILRAHAAAHQAMRGFGQSLDGEILVGLMPSMTRCALAPALARFMNQHPNVSVRIVEAYSAVLTERVRAGALAFAIVPAAPVTSGLRSRLFGRTPEILVAASARGLPHRTPVRLATFGKLKLVLPGTQNARRRSLDSYFATNAIEVDRILELDAMLGALDLVAQSDWLTIVPGIMMADELTQGRWSVQPLADPPLTVELMLIEPSKRPLDAATGAFLQILEAETNRINTDWGQVDATRQADE
jgi:LysR family nitrogen assimilation transcriptional regulator